MASQNIARLGVVLGLDTAEFTASIDKAIAENVKLKNAIRRETDAAAKEITALKYATDDYGKVVSKVTQIEREMAAGRFKNATADVKKQLLDQAKAYDAIAMSAKNAAGAQFKMNEQQKLQLTYQTTDLFTQIASGQNPLIAIMQQGGQLKDSMGGLGNMFKALGTFITPVSVGMTALAASIGVAAFAAYEANQEFDQFQNSLTLTGNYVGVTAHQLVSMSREISQSVGTTVGVATSALDTLVSSGKYSATSIEAVTKAVLTYSKIAGVDGKQAAEALMSGLDGTASGAKSLNEKMNFLTLAQYKQIEALEKAGKSQEGAKLAAEILSQRLEAQKRILGDVELAWDKAKNAMSQFWASFKEAISGPTTTTGVLEKVKSEIEALEFSLSKSTAPEKYTKADRERLEILKQRRKELEGIIDAAKKSEVPESEKPSIKEYDKYKDMLKGKESELEKAKIEARFAEAKIGANELQTLELESQKKTAEALAEMEQKNRQEDGRAAVQNQKIYEEKVLAIQADLENKKQQIRTKNMLSEYQEFVKTEEEKTAAEVAEDNRRAMLRTDAQKTTQGLEYEKERLQLKYQLVYATEKEQKLAMISLEYARKRKETEGKPDEEFHKNELNRQEELAKLNVNIQESMQKTQQVFDTVWGNMGSAIDNFVKTGKLSMKDFARSVIQDLIAIQMKAAMLRFLGGIFASSNPMTMSQTDFVNASGGRMYADGGEPPVGKVSLVGERGPELFVPRTAGTIIPNHALNSIGSTTNVTNNYINAIDTKSFEDRLLGSSSAIWAANQYANKSLAVSRGRT